MKLTETELRARNESIAAEFAAGASHLSLAIKHGLSRRQINNITRAAGIHIPRGERVHRSGGGYPLVLKADQRRRYFHLRRNYGAQRAREMMGIGA